MPGAISVTSTSISSAPIAGSCGSGARTSVAPAASSTCSAASNSATVARPWPSTRLVATPRRRPFSAPGAGFSSASRSKRPCWAFVAGSAGSTPARAHRSRAASATLRHIGPAVSCENAMGTMPWRDTRPSVGFTPTRPCTAAGDVTEPSVSVPTPSSARLAASAAPVPEEEPLGERSSA